MYAYKCISTSKGTLSLFSFLLLALLSKGSPSQGTVPSSPSPATTARNLDPREHEVDELLSWTNSLP